MKIITIDFESRSACDLKKAGAWAYSCHPTTEVLCLWVADREGRTTVWYSNVYNRIVHGRDEADPFPEWLTAAIEEGTVFEAHNALFERGIWTNIMVERFGWPEIPPGQWFDTMAACAAHGLPLDLDTVTHLLKLPTVKNRDGSAALKKIMKPMTIKRGEPKGFIEDPELFRTVGGDYGRDDALSQMHLGKRLGPLSDTEHNVWLLNQRMNLRGIRLDIPFVADCQHVVDEAREPLADAFSDLTGGIKPKSPKLRAWINERMGREAFDNLQKDTVQQALAEWTLPPDVREALDMKAALTSASVDKLKAMFACVGNDARARGLIQYGGAVSTLRDAGRLLQPQNFPRGTVEFERDLDGNRIPPWEFLVPAIQSRDVAMLGAMLAHHEKHISDRYKHLVAPISAVTSALRHAIVAAPGKVLMAGDYSTIEVRVLLALAGQHDKVQLLAEGLDPYCDYAGQVLGRELNKDEHSKERQDIGKPGVLGLGFQMGASKFESNYGQKDWEPGFADQLVETYRKQWAPMVPKLWYGLQEASTKAVWDRTPQEYNGLVYQLEDEWLTCRLPSGRKLWYFAPRQVNKEMPWSTEEEPDIRPGWTYRAKKYGKVREIPAYGGLLAENAVQATARDILYSRAPLLEEHGMPLVLTVHDENVTEPDERTADQNLMKQIMEERTDWVRELGVPVTAECWTGDRYRK